MVTPFSHELFPPAPVLDVRLSAPAAAPTGRTLTALIDTGADFTIVPLRWLLEASAPETRAAYARGIWSPRQLVTLYLVDIHLDQMVLPGVEVVGTQSEYGESDDDPESDEQLILGRNVLNRLLILLDGPNQQTHLLARAPRL